MYFQLPVKCNCRANSQTVLLSVTIELFYCLIKPSLTTPGNYQEQRAILWSMAFMLTSMAHSSIQCISLLALLNKRSSVAELSHW